MRPDSTRSWIAEDVHNSEIILAVPLWNYPATRQCLLTNSYKTKIHFYHDLIHNTSFHRVAPWPDAVQTFLFPYLSIIAYKTYVLYNLLIYLLTYYLLYYSIYNRSAQPRSDIVIVKIFTFTGSWSVRTCLKLLVLKVSFFVLCPVILGFSLALMA